MTKTWNEKAKETINLLATECNDTAREKGWWDTDRSDGELIALMHSELSEALEEMRQDNRKDHVAEELADVIIRVFDYCGKRDLDIGEALIKKMEFNKTRPYRHGKKF